MNQNIQNLRQEIDDIIRINITQHMTDKMAVPFSYLLAGKIIDVIEKRIDERIGQLKFFEEHLNRPEVKFNTKKENQKLARNAIQNKILTFEEVKGMLK